MIDSELKERFWKNVDKKGVDECWPWTASANGDGYKTGGGYGQLQKNRKKLKAHRISYEIHNGKIPDGKWVLHSCGKSLCVNPNHLYIGTHQDNVNDKQLHGTQNRGTTHYKARLTEEQVQEIRWFLFVDKIPREEIAEMYGMSEWAIYDIQRDRRWGWLPKTLALLEVLDADDI